MKSPRDVQREIKFRGLSESGWKYIDLTGSMAWSKDLLTLISEKDTAFHFKSPLMQFTGLKDKNGKEIYEGDILEGPYYCNGNMRQEDGKDLIRQVQWGDSGDSDGYSNEVHCEWIVGNEDDCSTLPDVCAHSVVIGNIYETLELLK